MNDFSGWLARSVGIGHELASKVDRLEWHWARPEVLFLGLVLLVPIGWWIARRHEKRLPWLSRRLRTALTICRIAVLFLMVFVLAGPFVRLDERIDEKPVVALIVDESISMSLPVGRLSETTIGNVATAVGLEQPAKDDPVAIAATVARLASLTRAELVRRVLDSQGPTTFRQLSDRFDLRRYTVARRAIRIDATNAAPSDVPSDKPVQEPSPDAVTNHSDSLDTALGSAIELAMDDASGRSLAAIILLTDGRSTIGIDPIDAVRKAAEASGGQPRAPIMAVPIGSIDLPVDVAIVEVLAAPEVALDDTVSIVSTIQSSNMTGKKVAVELRDVSKNVLDTVPITLSEGRQQAVFSWHAKEVGATVLTISVVPEPEETIHENNSIDFPVEVSSRKSKVLVIDGVPRWDLRFLDHAIRRDTGFEATIVLANGFEEEVIDGGNPTTVGTAGESSVKGVPQNVDAWAAYDLVILGDVKASVLTVEIQKALIEAVEKRGVGVVFQPGGEHLPRDYAHDPLNQLFPVEIDYSAGNNSAAIEAPEFKPFRMRVTARGAMHPAFALSGDASRNRTSWSEMPAFFRAAAAVLPKPSATVLAEVDQPNGRTPLVLMAEAPVGRGRVAWIGTEETFRWRRNIGDPLFWRFWGQALRSVARREDRPWDTNWLVIGPSRCEPGSPVFIELNLLDAAKQPVVAPHQTVDIGVKGSVETVELRPAQRPGMYHGTYTPNTSGRHAVAHLSEQKPLTADLIVADSTRERARPGVDRETLRSLADITGGAVIEVDAFSTIPYRLTEQSIESRKSLEDDVWDTWPVLLLLVGFYCVDVGIRRLSGLS